MIQDPTVYSSVREYLLPETRDKKGIFKLTENQLIQRYEKYISRYARTSGKLNEEDIELEDLQQEYQIVLIRCARAYQVHRNVPFEVFLKLSLRHRFLHLRAKYIREHTKQYRLDFPNLSQIPDMLVFLKAMEESKQLHLDEEQAVEFNINLNLFEKSQEKAKPSKKVLSKDGKTLAILNLLRYDISQSELSRVIKSFVEFKTNKSKRGVLGYEYLYHPTSDRLFKALGNAHYHLTENELVIESSGERINRNELLPYTDFVRIIRLNLLPHLNCLKSSVNITETLRRIRKKFKRLPEEWVKTFAIETKTIY